MRFQRGLSAVPVQLSAPLRIIFHLINQTLFSRYFSTAAAATTTSTTTATAMTTTTTTKNKKRRGKQIYVIFPPPWPRQKNNLVFFLSFSPPPHPHPASTLTFETKRWKKGGRCILIDWFKLNYILRLLLWLNSFERFNQLVAAR